MLLYLEYFQELYRQRKIGRSRDEVIADSAAISPVDNFWVTKEGLNHTWESLQAKRDVSYETSMTTLKNQLNPKDQEKAFKGEKDDYLSVFTIKGNFAKAVYNGYILKKDNYAEYEVSAYNLAKSLGISCAVAEMREDSIVYLENFTHNTGKSMVHASELLYDLFSHAQNDNQFELAYRLAGENYSFVKALDRLLILSYLVANMDLHEDNFGFLYDTNTFDVVELAPAFDFNSAFRVYEDPTLCYRYVMDNLKEMLDRNPDILERK